MNGYVATAFGNKEAAREAMALLRAHGHGITHDWTQESADGKTDDELPGFLVACAKADMDGVKGSDFIVVLHHKDGRGMLIEFGVALGQVALGWTKMLLVVDGEGSARTDQQGSSRGELLAKPIFYRLPGVKHFKDVATAVAFLDGYAAGRVLTSPF